MSQPHPLTALTEREWAQAWDAEQLSLDALQSNRGSWLPNVVETRDWGAIRWTSGRPGHAGATGQAALDTVAVFRPTMTDSAIRSVILEALRDRPPVRRVLGYGFRTHHIRGAVIGAPVGVVAAALVAILAGAGALVAVAAAVVGAAAGAVGGVVYAHVQFRRRRSAVLGDIRNVRIVTARYAPPTWNRLLEAATQIACDTAARGGAHPQTQAAIHAAVWEAAELLLERSDHTGVAILADDVERLARAERGA